MSFQSFRPSTCREQQLLAAKITDVSRSSGQISLCVRGGRNAIKISGCLWKFISNRNTVSFFILFGNKNNISKRLRKELSSSRCSAHTANSSGSNLYDYLGSRVGAVLRTLAWPTNVSRVRFPDPASYVGWVCCWSLLCSESRFFSGYSGFPLSSKANISKFQFDPGMHGHLWTGSLSSLVLHGQTNLQFSLQKSRAAQGIQ